VAARIPDRTGFAGSPAGRLHTERVIRPLHGHETARAWLANRGVSGEFVALAPAVGMPIVTCAQPGPAVGPLEHHCCPVELDVPPVTGAPVSIMQGEETRRAVRAGD